MAERTEPATAKRRTDARNKGQVAKSTELISAIALMTAVIFLAGNGSSFVQPLVNLMRQVFSRYLLTDVSSGMLLGRPVDLANELGLLALGVITGILPFFMALMVIGVITTIAQVGFKITPAAMMPSLGKLNPISGISRLFSKNGLVELGKALVKILLVGYVAFGVFSASYGILLRLNEVDLLSGFGSLGAIATDLGKTTSGWLLGLAVVDFVWQRRSFESSLKMTKQEVSDEAKQQEPPQIVRQQIRRKQRQMAMSRMMAAVPNADVILTNPTHYAVALFYDPNRMSAPTVCAKGQRIIAQQIVRSAKEHRVPIVQNPPLARVLFHNVEVGMPIPPNLYTAVAEVLAFVFRLKKEREYGR
jgi:flagellar biosynthetic protein FlhB